MDNKNQNSLLGFGLMRLPKKGIFFDVPQIEKMVDLYLSAGFNYFDTAYVYKGSENVTRKALVERHPRESYTLATKINAYVKGASEKTCKEQFFTSLKRTGAGYFDYYLLHSLMDDSYTKYDDFKLWDFALEQKAKGLVKNVGFSFHGGPATLDKILTEKPFVDFVQLQINYADWDDPKIASRENYEVARKHGKPIIIMEPVKGGALAKPPKKVEELFKGYDKTASSASWAIRFAASLPGVISVLSGMSNLEQINDNLSYMKSFKPLNEAENEIIKKAQEAMNNSKLIKCTGCGYCVADCPKKIAIPQVFTAMNKSLDGGSKRQAKSLYKKATENGGKASACVKCGKCENVCPQHLNIRELLSKCANELEA